MYFFKNKKLKDLHIVQKFVIMGNFILAKYNISQIQLKFSYGILDSYKIILKKNSQGQII